MTLIEVLAGLVVLGTVLSGILIARNRFAQQLATANLKLEAAEQADALIEEWTASLLGPPLRGSGRFGERLVWRTGEVRSVPARELRSRVVRLEVFDRESFRSDDERARPLLRVDLLAAVPAARKLPVQLAARQPASRPSDVPEDPDGQPQEGQPTTPPTSQPAQDQVYEDPRLLDGIYQKEK